MDEMKKVLKLRMEPFVAMLEYTLDDDRITTRQNRASCPWCTCQSFCANPSQSLEREPLRNKWGDECFRRHPVQPC